MELRDDEQPLHGDSLWEFEAVLTYDSDADGGLKVKFSLPEKE